MSKRQNPQSKEHSSGSNIVSLNPNRGSNESSREETVADLQLKLEQFAQQIVRFEWDRHSRDPKDQSVFDKPPAIASLGDLGGAKSSTSGLAFKFTSDRGASVEAFKSAGSPDEVGSKRSEEERN